MKKSFSRALGVAILVGTTACATIPPDAFKLSGSAVEDRRIQSRIFELSDEVKLMAAGIAVLQDMGYSIDETEKNVGLVTASKDVDATNGAQIAGAILLAMLGGGSTPVDKSQKIRVSLVTKPSANEKDGYLARITFQRIVTNTHNQISRVETIKEESLYSDFFDKLSKSVFLEAHSI